MIPVAAGTSFARVLTKLSQLLSCVLTITSCFENIFTFFCYVNLFDISLYVCMFILYVFMCPVCIPGACGGQKGTLNALEVELGY